MRSLSGLVLCVCAALATSFSPTGQEDPFGGTRPLRTASPPSPPRAPAPVNLSGFSGQYAPIATSPGQSRFPSGFFRAGRTSKAEAKLSGKINSLKGKLSSEDADTRATAEEELETAVSELFDMRTNTRKKQIEDLEERLATLRKQLEKREDNKSEIVRLHVKTMVNEAKGLGF